KDVVRFDEKLVALRESWVEENERQFEHNQECECPTCGQALPEAELEAAKEKAVSAFNLSKVTELEKIDNNGIATAEDKTLTLEQIEKLKVTVASLQSDIEVKEKVVTKLTS